MADIERYEGGIEYVNSGNLFEDARQIIDKAQHAARQSVNILLVARNWLLGKRIAEEELAGADRADYGKQTIRQLSDELTDEYGKGFDQSSLYKFVRFYREFPNILDSLSPKSAPLLSWTHYRVLLQVEDADARDWYAREAARETWSVRTLQRNVSSQYYYRMLATHRKDLVKDEMQELTSGYQADKYEFVKSPVIAEFLGFPEDKAATLRERELEDAIITNRDSPPACGRIGRRVPSTARTGPQRFGRRNCTNLVHKHAKGTIEDETRRTRILFNRRLLAARWCSRKRVVGKQIPGDHSNRGVGKAA